MSHHTQLSDRLSSSPLLGQSAMAMYSLVLAYGGGLWLHLLHEAEGATELNAPPGVIHWLRDSTLSLPLVVVGVVLACLLARRLLERYGDGASGLLVGAAVAAAVALYTSVVVAGGNPLHGLLFQAHEHANPDKELPVAIHMLKDSLLVLSANLVLAGGLVAMVAARAWVASQYRARRSFAARVSLAVGLVLLPSLVNGAAAIPVEAAIDPGNPCPTGAPARTFDVSAINVKIPLNRFGDNDPKGLMYTLTSHIGDANTVGSVRWEEAKQSTAIGLHSQVINGQQFEDAIQPLVLRANEGDCVTITFHNRINDNNTFGIHIDGLAYQVGSSGDAVGNNGASDVPNGGNATYVYYVPNDPDLEGAHHLHPGPSNRAATNHGLFGALVVEPVGSVYYKQNVNQNPDGTFAQVAQDSGWEAMIVPPAPAKAFRENVQAYHEIGNESEDVFDKNNNALPRVDPHTESYRPGARAMNYRSEPFMDRLNIAPEQESLAYASYTFADPATVTPHSYQRDPMKFRLIHAGSEVFHVFHLHGGGIRWRYNPKSDPTYNYGDTGLSKKPVVYSQSQRLDSQAFGPGESYNLEIEGGSGGVQQGAGEFLFHCHIVKHYVSGMWGFWRVFNTLQADLAPLPDRAATSADLTYNMREIPAPVTSDQLIGKTFNQVDASGNVTNAVTITAANLKDWIEPQLPPQGKRTGFEDAQIWDWTRDPANPNLFLGEPDDANTANYPETMFGLAGHPFAYKSDKYVGSIANRPAILFDPENGRYAWPLLRPHIGQRPPFAPMGHSGAPYLGENANDVPQRNLTDSSKVDPYAGRVDGLCPAGTNPRHYNVVAIQVNNQVTAAGATDPGGLIFSLAQDKANFQNGTTHPEPLAIRANIGDCVAVTLTSEEQDPLFFGNHAKVNLHIHHVQFDTNSSDGVITGMSFEQSVRPYQAEDPQLAADAKVGDTTIKLSSVAKFHEEAFIGVGLGTENIEILKIKSIDSVNNVITFDNSFRNGVISGGCGATPNQTGAFIAPVGATNGCPTAAAGSVAHPAGQWAGVEFVQERWYPDVALDNIFWHDHVDGIHGWGHGLVGMLNIEPTGATYHNPKTGALTDGAGTLSDIYADPTAQNHQLIPGFVDGSFREWSVWTIDSNPVTDSTINLTAEPWANRLNTAVPNQADPSLRFSSYVWGDPYTPMPRAYVGDPFVIRTINVSQRADTLHLDGHRFFYETRFTGNTGGYQASNPATYNNGNVAPGSAKPIASPYDTIHYGVSERFTFALDGGAGGLQKQAGDYLYMNGLDKRFRDGAWGIFRVFDPALGGVSDLVALPDRPAATAGAQVLPTVTGARPPAASGTGNPCPTGAPQHKFAISAVELPSQSNTGAGSPGRKSVFVPNAQVASVKGGSLFPEPLVMHVAQGQCVTVTLTDQRPVARSSFHLGGLLRGTGSSGADIGFNPEQTVAPGQSITYTFFADDQKVESALISDFGGSPTTAADGGFDEPTRDGSYGALIVSPPGATFTNSISGAPTDVGTQVDVHIAGQPSYRDYTVIQAEQDPLIGTDAMPYPPTMSGPSLINYRTADLQNKRQQGPGFFSSLKNGDPGTPILAAYKGDPMTIHVVGAPGSEQVKTGYLGGLQFPTDAFIPDSDHRDYKAVGPWEKFDAHILGGMGSGKLVGDMAYGTGRLAYTDGGMWGLLRSAFSGNTSGCRVFSNGQLAPKPLDGRCPTS